MLNIPAYLDRIRYSGSTAISQEVLRDLHRAHLLNVPFENLDIGLGRKIVCEEEAFLRKVVEQHRGGFCYELNGAFAALLQGLGFRVTLLSARVPREDGSDGPEFDHLALRVDLQEAWLADVGFGESFLEPLRLEPDAELRQNTGTFRIAREGNSLRVERNLPNEVWKSQYCFGLTPRRLDEFAPMCHYHQTSPESPFTRKSVCTRATPGGRITLSGWRLIRTSDGKREESSLNSDQEWRDALKQYFEVVL